MMILVMLSPLLIVLFIVMGVLEERRRNKKRSEQKEQDLPKFEQGPPPEDGEFASRNQQHGDNKVEHNEKEKQTTSQSNRKDER